MSIKPIALRIMNPELYKKVEILSKEQDLSLNMTINMLLGFSFNEIAKQNKKFEKKVVFELKQQYNTILTKVCLISILKKNPWQGSFFVYVLYGSIEPEKLAHPNNYSTSEHRTGRKWIDGKDVWTKTVTGNITVSANIRSSSELVTGVDALIGGKGGFKEDASANVFVSIPGSRINSSNNTTGFSSILNVDGVVSLYTRSEYNRNTAPFYVVIEYTKK